MTSAIPVQRSTNLADKPTGSVHNDQLPVSLLAQLVEVLDLNHVQA